MARSARRTSKPQTFLQAVAAAEDAYVGRATTVSDEAQEAASTRGRGAGYRIVAEIVPEKAIFGTLPEGAQRVSGEVAEAPDNRLTPGEAHFPPDTLRETPYWAYARLGNTDPVLVIDAGEPYLRLLSGPEDPLADAAATVKAWLDAGDDLTATRVLADLSRGGAPAGGVAGFELLLQRGADAGLLLAAWIGSPGVSDAVRAGCVAALPPAPGTDMVRLLVALFGAATGPATLVALARALEPHRPVWTTAADLSTTVQAAAERARTLHFDDDEYAAAWRKRVAYQVDLLQGDNGT